MWEGGIWLTERRTPGQVIIIPRYQSDGETTKLSSVASWHERLCKLKTLSQMTATQKVYLKESRQPGFSLHQSQCGDIGGKWHPVKV